MLLVRPPSCTSSSSEKSSPQFLLLLNRLRMELADSADDDLEMHHVEGAFVETILPKSKTPPQEMLLKLEKEKTFMEQSQESSMFTRCTTQYKLIVLFIQVF